MMELLQKLSSGLYLSLIIGGVILVAIIALVSRRAARPSRKYKSRYEPSFRDFSEEDEGENGAGMADMPLETGRTPDPRTLDPRTLDPRIPEPRTGIAAGALPPREERAPPPVTASVVSASNSRPEKVYNLIDYVVTLVAPSGAFNRAQVLEIMATLPPQPEMPVRVHGWSAEGTGSWHEINATDAGTDVGTTFQELVFAMQLADRSRAASDADLELLHGAVSAAAAAAGGRIEVNLQRQQVRERRRELSELARQTECIIEISIFAAEGRSFSGADIVKVTNEFGLVLGKMDIYHKNATVDGEEVTLFSMANFFDPGSFGPDRSEQASTRGLLLFMNVPLMSNPGGIFNTMSVVAKGMCRRLEGTLVSRDQMPLRDAQLEQIRVDILKICSDMHHHGITPGHAEAHKLFG